MKTIKNRLLTLLTFMLVAALLCPVNTFAAAKSTLTLSSSQMTIRSKKATLKAGKKATLKATLKTTDSNGKTKSQSVKATKVKWTSSNSAVAAVSKKGVITAKKKGKAVITAAYKNRSAKITLTVAAAKTGGKVSTSAMKTAYKKVIQEYKKKGYGYYYLYDMDKNGVKELIVTKKVTIDVFFHQQGDVYTYGANGCQKISGEEYTYDSIPASGEGLYSVQILRGWKPTVFYNLLIIQNGKVTATKTQEVSLSAWNNKKATLIEWYDSSDLTALNAM